MYQRIFYQVRVPLKIVFIIEVAEIKRYIVPEVALETRGFILKTSIAGTSTNPAPTPTIPEMTPATNPAALSTKKVFFYITLISCSSKG
jgi:hypothetical protein